MFRNESLERIDSRLWKRRSESRAIGDEDALRAQRSEAGGNGCSLLAKDDCTYV
jgi:hypothetical protein